MNWPETRLKYTLTRWLCAAGRSQTNYDRWKPRISLLLSRGPQVVEKTCHLVIMCEYSVKFIYSSTIFITKGIHIVLPSYYAPEGIGLVDMSTSDGRFLFLLPWQVASLHWQTDFHLYLYSYSHSSYGSSDSTDSFIVFPPYTTLLIYCIYYHTIM